MTRAAATIPTALLLLVAASCASAPKQTSLMKAAKNVGVTAQELRLRVRDLAPQVGGIVEDAADEIAAASPDPQIRRAALRWKLEAIPRTNQAVFRQDPLLALVDVWAFTLQLRTYLTEGDGRDLFGPQQPIALDAAEQMIDTVEALALRASATGNIDAARELIAGWAAETPIEGPSLTRVSMVNFVADVAAASRAGGFATVGQLQTDVADLAARIDLFADQLPKFARWQSQYVVGEYASREDVVRTLEDVDRMADSLESASAMVDRLGGVALQLTDSLATEDGGAASFLDEQREAVFREMERQLAVTLDRLTRERIAVLEEVRAERGVVLAAVTAERQAALHSLAGERETVLREAEAMAGRLVEQAGGQVERAIDHLFWRLVQLAGGVLLVLAAGAFWLVRRLAPAPA
ncbi:MAG: hypothetical protein PVF68_07820 [Acidobacteriota bacterium]|jgi:hypothetical protein